MVGAGAHAEDVSVLLGPAVSGANYEVPAAMADEVEAALPGSRTVTSAGTPGLDLRAGILRQLTELGVAAVDDRPAVHRRRCDAVQPPPGRADRPIRIGGVDGMTGAHSGSQAREIALMTALAKLRERLALAAEAVGRKPTEIELLPVTKFFPATDVAILSKLGCRAFGESREQEAAAKVAAVAALVPEAAARGIALAHGRSDPAQQGQIDCRHGRIRCIR